MFPSSRLQGTELLSSKAESSSEGSRREVSATGPAAAKRGTHRARRGDPGRVPTRSATESTPEIHEKDAKGGEERKVLLHQESSHISTSLEIGRRLTNLPPQGAWAPLKSLEQGVQLYNPGWRLLSQALGCLCPGTNSSLWFHLPSAQEPSSLRVDFPDHTRAISGQPSSAI